jgi:hypothetical protein
MRYVNSATYPDINGLTAKQIICGFCNGKHSGRLCPEVANKPVQDLTFFKNILPMDNIKRHALSSAKSNRVPEFVKKLKENRKEQRETTNTNAYAAHIRLVKEEYRQYIAKRDNPKTSMVPDDSVINLIDVKDNALISP